MKYKLVAQWRSDLMDSYDAMIRTEDALCEFLTDQHSVDGHDVGTGEVNIFVDTDDVQAAFSEVKAILLAEGQWDGVRIAYRLRLGEKYSILWPESLREFRVM
ncbi:MAG: hypothetical protein ACJ8IK_07365 [Burkholderiaceae bacterium]